MKPLYIIPLVLLSACASNPKPVVLSPARSVPGTTITAEGVESVRYAENIKTYPVGRYIDPNNRLVMHEGHTIYRVETTGKWNLHPNVPVVVPAGPMVRVVDAAYKDSPVTAEVIAEVSRQKAATQAVIEQGGRLNDTLGQLAAAANASRQAGEQNQQIKRDLDATRQRLDLLETEIRKQQGVAALAPQQPAPVKTNSSAGQ